MFVHDIFPSWNGLLVCVLSCVEKYVYLQNFLSGGGMGMSYFYPAEFVGV